MNKFEAYSLLRGEITLCRRLEGRLEILLENLMKRREIDKETDLLVNPILKETYFLLSELVNLPMELEEMADQIKADLLFNNYGLKIGDKVSYEHPRLNDKGELIIDEFSLSVGESERSSIFYLWGRKYRKDGKIGKRIIHESLPLLAGDGE